MSHVVSGSERWPDDALAHLLLARSLAKEAGDLIMHLKQSNRGHRHLSIDSKSGSSDLVTSADLASQKLIFEKLSRRYPKHRLIGEEDGQPYGVLDDRPTWIVDAIDGTTNFVHGLSDYAVSIAFAARRNVEVGVVYKPAKREMFSAVRGRVAYLNDVPIHASECSELSTALILSEWGYVRSQPGAGVMLGTNERLLEANCRGVRQLGIGSLYMCYVAMGRLHCKPGSCCLRRMLRESRQRWEVFSF